jgi:hypothetical protein
MPKNFLIFIANYIYLIYQLYVLYFQLPSESYFFCNFTCRIFTAWPGISSTFSVSDLQTVTYEALEMADQAEMRLQAKL